MFSQDNGVCDRRFKDLLHVILMVLFCIAATMIKWQINMKTSTFRKMRRHLQVDVLMKAFRSLWASSLFPCHHVKSLLKLKCLSLTGADSWYFLQLQHRHFHFYNVSELISVPPCVFRTMSSRPRAGTAGLVPELLLCLCFWRLLFICVWLEVEEALKSSIILLLFQRFFLGRPTALKRW